MTQKIAVAVVHGIGKTKSDFANKMMAELKKRFFAEVNKKASIGKTELVIKPVYWSPILQKSQDELWNRIYKNSKLRYKNMRQFMVNFAADAIAYQPTPQDRHLYDAIHQKMAEILSALAKEAGPKAPLCIVAHSLGSIISSNYLYDLQTSNRKKILPEKISKKIGKTPLEKGDTLTLFYTLGSPIALWSLRYPNFGIPINVPSPLLKKHYPKLKGEWINFYDKDDIIAYPLKNINEKYTKAVTADKSVNIGSFISSWNPMCHVNYWTDNDITKPIAKSLARLWIETNQI